MPSDSKSNRKLAAIFFADIVGYTALMQKDEPSAANRLHRFQNLIKEKVNDFGGSIGNFYGDGALCLFNSPLEAVKCAIALQTLFMADPKVPVRIGIHTGTVVYDANEVYGDCVNIASRIESMGIPGAILLSKQVRDELKNQPDLSMSSLGTFSFKNVDDPIEVFALSNEGFAVPKQGEIKGKIIAESNFYKKYFSNKFLIPTLLLLLVVILLTWINANKDVYSEDLTISNKSIAVLPFRNLSTAEENQFFCDGVMEAILNHLSKIDGLKVISRSSVEQYKNTDKMLSEIAKDLNVSNILEGSVQRAGDKVRITTQLILPNNNQQVWSEIYDRQINDIFAIQSEVALSIASQLAIELTPQAQAIMRTSPANNLKAYDFYLKGNECLIKYRFQKKQIQYDCAVENFKNAIKLDTSLALAFVGLAMSNWSYYERETFLEETYMDTVKILCERALSIDENLPDAHALLGTYYLSHKNEEAFIEGQLKAININESYAPAYANLGSYYAFQKEEFLKGIELYNKSIELDPFSPMTNRAYMLLSWIYMKFNAIEEAEFYAMKIRDSGDYSLWNPLVHIYLIQGEYDIAEEVATEWLEHTPEAYRYLTEIAMNRDQNYKQAIEWYKEYEKHYPNEINYRQRYGLAYLLDGQIEKGEELLQEAFVQYEKTKDLRGHYYCYDIAGAYATIGETEKALEILADQECSLSSALEIYISIDPLFKNLWELDKFKEIVQARIDAKSEIRKKIRAANLKG